MASSVIDLRSDTVTKPSKEMRAAMAAAEVGDDVFGEDPTVNRLQAMVADMLGKEAALFVPSGTMGNQLCIKVHTKPGDEVIAERGSHVFNYETAGAAFLSSVQIYPIGGTYGVMNPADVKAAIRPTIYYMPRTRLVCLENTHNRAGGTIYPLSELQEISGLARNQGISVHLDGARLWNASVASGIPPHEYASYVDSISVCLSKGLGAPVGSVVAGPREFVEEARHYRKIFGGGMRQAGVLAAAGLYALEHNVNRLLDDHEKARAFAESLSEIRCLEIDLASVQTNIVLIDISKTHREPREILAILAEKGVLLTPGNQNGLRAVMHMDVSLGGVQGAVRIMKEAFSEFS